MNDGLSIVLCGEAGQGIQTVEAILVKLLAGAGFHVFATKEYMSRIRGGSNSTQLRVSSGPVAAPLDRIDIFLPLDKAAIPHLRRRIGPDTLVIGDRQALAAADEIVEDVPFSAIAAHIGGPIYANSAAAGVLAGLLGLGEDAVIATLQRAFSSKPSEVVAGNGEAARLGLQRGKDIAARRPVAVPAPSQRRGKYVLVNGADAVALGALAGGCDFIGSYPMSPSTGVLTYLSRQAAAFGVVAEQTEDEISAINMAVGAAYAGARPLVTTSGGGFALMVEGLSLAGMTETPVVIHLAQRPGPATGLPTRTEQADLEFALYAGHGEFPRILLAPGNLEQAFRLARHAFDLADRFQSPALVLTDQYLMDSYYDVPAFDVSGPPPERRVVRTEPGYRRYRLTADGLSPRGLPGWGEGLVAVDSDEHDESGRITEDLALRSRMVEKRQKKLELIREAALPPERFGPEDPATIVVCWGSTLEPVREAVRTLGDPGTAVLHFSQVHPLSASTPGHLSRARRIVCVEGNQTGQFARLLKLATGIEVHRRILKYDGLQFTVEELVRALGEMNG
jgi:2-oxoglutarate ferredoxin oxidoreductase subunit alpha